MVFDDADAAIVLLGSVASTVVHCRQYWLAWWLLRPWYTLVFSVQPGHTLRQHDVCNNPGKYMGVADILQFNQPG